MFCPHCGNEISSERMRFCTRCSFPLTPVKELVEAEAKKSKADDEKKNYPLRQQDISLGAGVMIIGLIKAILLQIGFGGGERAHELLVIALAFGLFFGAVLLFSQLSHRQRGMTVGATMIFLGALIGLAAGLAGTGPLVLFLVVGISLLISLFWMRLAGAFKRLFFDNEPARESPSQTPLQPMFYASDTGHAIVETEERVQPISITEDTTSLLNKS